ncbi:RNA-binding KH domain-containing protein [Rhynchospora pubera]|uniref:RNA-binding KH domain-containing protein n=1 Tax=Rhynchospora pubera TaxID=906938 RepID=A0AAV8EF44_9POAL|nr:RNA-binding KH domain-containing protein [Rhynchospora pubera]
MPGGKPKHNNNKGGPPPRKRWNPNFGSPNFSSAKRKKPNEEELADEAPIETLYRILCPIRKIGSVLGRGGDIIKSLRAETNAKILVADAVSGSDDRVIIVYSHASDRPEDAEQEQEQEQDHDGDHGEARNATSNDELNGDGLKPLCAAQDALLKVNDRIAADEILHGGGEELEVAARILIPRNQAGCVIGKGGMIIQQLRADTGAGIRVLPPDTLPPCAMRSDELVQISGIPSLVKKALYQISTYLHVNPRKENPPLKEIIYASTYGGFGSQPPPYENQMWGPPRGPPGPPQPAWGYDPYRNDSSNYGYGSGGYNKGRSDKYEEFILRLLCPAWRIGGIIGKRGMHVRQLEEDTGAHLQVEETMEADERVLAISAKESLSEPVSQVIKALVQLQSHTTPSDEGPVVTKLIVPSQRVGCIIGEGGTIISEMRRRTGAGIRVYTKEMRPNFLSPDDELVEITGNPHTAREALIEVCTRLRTRTLRSGDTVPAAASSYEYPPAESGGYPPPPAGPGYPPPGPGYPPANHGYPPPNPGYPPPGGAYPPPSGSYPPPDASGYPPPSGGYPPPSSGYPPPAAGGYPPSDGGYGGYPPADRAYAPPAEGGYPPANTGYPPASGAYPPANGGYPPPTSGYPPASGGYPQPPATGTYSQPPPGSEYPPTGTGYPPPTGGYPPTASGYAPSAADGGYPHATHGYHPPSDSGYPAADSGYPPPAQGPGKSPGTGSTVPPPSVYHGYPQPAAGYESTQVAGHGSESQGYSAQPAPTGYNNANGAFEIRIPTTAVESVIGADGGNIAEIRKISGAKVTVHDPPPGVPECVVEIQGSSEQIQAAQGLVHAYMAQQNPPQSEAPATYQAPATWT